MFSVEFLKLCDVIWDWNNGFLQTKIFLLYNFHILKYYVNFNGVKKNAIMYVLFLRDIWVDKKVDNIWNSISMYFFMQMTLNISQHIYPMHSSRWIVVVHYHHIVD